MAKIPFYASLASIYSYTIDDITYRKRCAVDVCFGSSLTKCNDLKNTAEYTIVVGIDTSFIEHDYLNNYCWLNKHQLENYLRRISSLKPFKYKVRKSTYHKHPCFKIDLKIIGTRKEITFVLQCIKRTYEYPYNYFLYDAYEMQKLNAFRFDSILNLFNVVYSTFYDNGNTGHSFSGSSKFETYKTIKEKLPKVKFVTDLYPIYVQTPKKINLKETNCTDNWTTEHFRTLLPEYIRNYNCLKK
jgi:hypothetical protein